MTSPKRLGLVAICALVATAPPAAAQTVTGCDKAQTRIVTEALKRAKDLTLKAASQIGDTPEYTRWFGPYTQQRAETVRSNLKAIVAAMRTGGVTIQCHQDGAPACAQAEYAWVYPHRQFHVHICAPFFTLPPLEALRPGERRSDNGTREGTMVHEISHFNSVARTDDHCYSRSACAAMATESALRAIDNADSYQYFTEDVTYYARQPVLNKPVPAPRP